MSCACPGVAPDPVQFRLRRVHGDDYADIRNIMNRVYPGALGGAWSPHAFRAQIARFGEGQLCIEHGGRVVAAALSLIVDYERLDDGHTYADIVGNGCLGAHDESAALLYGIDMFVHPKYRGRGLGTRLHDARKALCRMLNLRAIAVGGRIPGYASCARRLDPPAYVEQVREMARHDPVLSFQLANGFQIRRVVRGYWPEDLESAGCATLLQWNNAWRLASRSVT